MSAPRLEIDTGKLVDNTRTLVDRLAPFGIAVTGVTKAALGAPEVGAAMVAGGVVGLGDSRVENLESLAVLGASRTLIRTPMLSQVDRVVASAGTSMNTEAAVIEALGRAAEARSSTHRVILMVELGDLREGIAASELLTMSALVLRTPGLALAGIGTNLACQSGVIPDRFNLAELSQLADQVERTFGVELDVVSGGNSSSLGWALASTDTGRINDLRLGESILLGRDPLDGRPIDGLHTDAFRLLAEVIEHQVKPSQPWGDIGRATFDGPSRPPSASGTRHQVLLALGHQDVDPAGLSASDGVMVLGASSDHLVVDAGDVGCEVGSELEFGLTYRALVRAMTSPFVTKVVHAHEAAPKVAPGLTSRLSAARR